MTSFNLARAIMQKAAKAEESRPLSVLVLDSEVARTINPRTTTLQEAAPYLRMLEVHSPDDLDGATVIHIPDGQKNHRLYENAESRRRSRMIG